MKYTSDFYSLKGDKYTVTIITNNNSGTTREITLGVPPFTTEMDTSDDNIYKPVKYQSATVNIVTSGESDYMFDLYSGEADGTRVTLTRNGDTIWDGFATPVVYNNGYTEIHENLELECIDGLSILQYYKYSSQNKTVLTFIEILNKVLQKCKVYNTLYVSNNTRLTESSALPILNELYISEQNFFDEKEDDETDDDVAWTCQEVLEEICQYLGLVCVGDGSNIYLMDLDAIKSNINSYTRYSIGSTAYTTVNLASPITIEEDIYRGGQNTISLDNVYNKVTVKDDFYTFDSVIPDLYNTATNITKDSDPDVASSEHVEQGMYGEIVNGNDGNMEVLLDRVYDPENEEYTTYYAVFVKYYTNPNYNFTCPSQLNYTDTKTMHGSVIAKFAVVKLDKSFSYMEQLVHELIYGTLTIDDWLAKNEISNPSFSNYVCLFNPLENHVESGATWITTNNTDTASLFGGENAYLIIKGSYCYHYVDEDPYPCGGDGIDIAEGRYAMYAGQTYLLAKLKWGSLYWNGSAWTSTNTTFRLPYLRDDSSDDDRRADATMFSNLNFINTVNWRIGTSEKGYAIKAPTSNIMNGLPELTIYSPIDPDYRSTSSGDDYGKWYKHTRVFLKDFDIKAIIGDPTFSDVNDSDTVYTNVIDNNHVQEFDEVEFKICTNDNKAPNYSSVAYKTNSDFHFLNQCYNQAFSINDVQERHYINRLCNQYKTPKIRLNLQLENVVLPYSIVTDKWLGTKKFIVDSQSIDYYNDLTNITLVEKG